MSRLSVPLRLARREVRRRPGRTVLVALLVALPVAGMAMAVTLIRTDATSRLEEWQRTYGQADAAGYELDVDAALPEGSRTVPVHTTWMRLRAADGARADSELTDLPLDDPLTAGIHDLVSGRAPARDGEVVLSTALAGHLGVDVGDELVLERPELTATVVGEVEPVGCLSCETAVFAPGTLPDERRAERGGGHLLARGPARRPVPGGAERGGGGAPRREPHGPGAAPSCGTSSVTTGVRRGCAGASCWARSCSPSSGS